MGRTPSCPSDMPGDNAVKRRVMHREKHLHVLIDGVGMVRVTRRDKLRKQPPMAWGQLGLGVGPVLDVQPPRVQSAADTVLHRRFADDAHHSSGHPASARCSSNCQPRSGEGRDECPVRADGNVQHMVVADQRLPAIRSDIRPGGSAGGGRVGVDEGGQVEVIIASRATSRHQGRAVTSKESMRRVRSDYSRRRRSQHRARTGRRSRQTHGSGL